VSDLAHLEADLTRLSEALAEATRELTDPATVARMHDLRRDALALRNGTLRGGRAAFAATIAAQSLDRLEDVAQVFTHWCHLMNAAEEQERIRTLRARDGDRDGLAAGVRALHGAGASADEVAALFDRALVMPVLTAHPTESRRRSILDHLGAIGDGLDELGRPLGGPARRDAEAELGAEVLALLGTEEARARRPTPYDEIDTAVEVFRRTLFTVTADVYADLEDALAATYPERPWRLPSFFRWGTWVGGDRDGNPNVTADVTRAVFERQRIAVVSRYLEDVAMLGRTLSVSARRGVDPDGVARLERSLEADRERLPEVAARARPRAPSATYIAFNLTRAAATIAGTGLAKATTATIRRKLISIPARIASSPGVSPSTCQKTGPGKRHGQRYLLGRADHRPPPAPDQPAGIGADKHQWNARAARPTDHPCPQAETPLKPKSPPRPTQLGGSRLRDANCLTAAETGRHESDPH